MAETFKRLGAVRPSSANTNTSLYVVPSVTSAVIDGITVCNQHATITYTFRIAHVDGAIGTLSAEDWVYYDTPITPKSTIEGILKGRAMAAGHTLVVQASVVDIISFTVGGVEIT